MNVYRFEVKAYLQHAIVFGLSMSLFGILFIALYPGFTKDLNTFIEILQAYPPKVLEVLGADVKMMGSFSGFYGYCMIYMVLCGAIQGMFVGISIIAKEKNRKTAEFIFSKPQTRKIILLAKLNAAFTIVSISFIIYTIATFCAAILFVGDIIWKELLLITLGLWLIQIIFVAIGFVMACSLKRIKVPVTTSLGICSIFFGIEMIVNGTDQKILPYVSLLTYFKPNDVVYNGGYELKYFLCWTVITIVSVVAGFLVFQKKDIQVG